MGNEKTVGQFSVFEEFSYLLVFGATDAGTNGAPRRRRRKSEKRSAFFLTDVNVTHYNQRTNIHSARRVLRYARVLRTTLAARRVNE